ncbi:hypothetical protein B7463_g12188, partial [Scytalidium lignicola]
MSVNGSESEFEFIETPKAATPTFEKFEDCGVRTTSYPAIKNAPLPADASGSDTFSNTLLFSILFIVPAYMAWKIGGGLKTTIFFAIFTSFPILMAFWTLTSSLSPRKNEKAKFPGRPVEHYLTFKNEADKLKYSGRNKIPMETFHNMYFDGDVDFNGDALEVMEYRHDWASFRFTLSLFKYVLFNFAPEVIMHTRSQDEEQVRDHYDRGDDFYAWFLGPRMIYTSGIISDVNKEETLEQLQDNKLAIVCEKIDLKEGESLLDIGCGWGTLAKYASVNYGAKVTGVTLGRNQTAWGNNGLRKAGVTEEQSKILCMDYRDIPVPEGNYNKITCLEMAEHVGIRHLTGFLKQVNEMLDDDGVFFLQVAGLRKYWQYEDLIWGLFMNKYVFPGADASTPLGFYISCLESAGFEVKGIDTVGVHYSATLWRWYRNWMGNRQKVEAKYGKRWFRIWEFFLAYSTITSRQGGATCYQITLVKNLNSTHRVEGISSQFGLSDWISGMGSLTWVTVVCWLGLAIIISQVAGLSFVIAPLHAWHLDRQPFLPSPLYFILSPSLLASVIIMYSGSNSYLGGNAGRPGPQYGNTFQGNQQTGQSLGYNSQPQNFGAAPQLQPNFTGYPLQAQQTGFQPQQQLSQPGFLGPQPTGQFQQAPQQQNFQTGVPPIPQIPQQFQQQQQQQPPPQAQFQSQPQPPQVQHQAPQPTGFAQVAASFQNAAPPTPAKPKGRRQGGGAKIPNIRLSFITASDQAKFEGLFKSAVGDGQALSGDKARDLLLRSKLDGTALSQIWQLSDTTKSGQLLFPEFALAMYLCNQKLIGKTLPSGLPENIKNEVSSMVDIISFGVADDAPAPAPAGNVPDFNARTTAASPPAIQQPQPLQSNSALLTAQLTGFPQPQQGGFPGQQQSLQFQPTGFQSLSNPQALGYNGPRPPMPPIPTGFNQGLSPAVTGPGGMVAPLNSQPTGRPGQWGLVNAPASGLPNIDALQARMMPQQGREQGSYTTVGLSGNAVIPWAVTKDEKTRYDSLFRAWDGFNKGFIGGDVAIEVFGQSGLPKTDLERVWTLADHGNKGRLNMDEFAVAMHLIYRKLNGYPLPAQLPPELVPPSTRNFNDSIGAVKSLLHQESDFRKNSGATLLPQKTGVSYLKSHSFRGDSGAMSGRKDATVYKNNDDDVGYKSSARRRIGNHSPRPDSPASVKSDDELTLDQLRKKVHEKQILLDAMDFKDEKVADQEDALDRKDRREAEDLYHRIRRIQEDIDAHPDAALHNVDSGAERRALKRQLQTLTDRLPEIASQVRKTERSIADAKLELFRLRDAKAHPGSASSIIGTGPGGTVTESDRLKARAKAMMQQRTAALTGRKIESNDEDLAAPKRLEEESIKIRTEKENNERLVQDVEDSVRDFSRGLEDSLKDGAEDSSSEHERRRWEDGLGVEDEVKEFIFDLQRSSRAARIRKDDRADSRSARSTESSRAPSGSHIETPLSSRRAEEPPRTASTPASTGGTYSQYKTPEERAAFIKQQAEQRMAERLAALGIRAPSKPGETAAQRLEREKSERAAKLRQAEEEDARREAERQARIAEEQGIPPPVPETTASPAAAAKKPPPPPSRKAAKSDAAEREAARKAEEERVLVEQKAQLIATQNMEDEAAQQEAELAKEREAAQSRLKALEEQVKAGKLKKEEEKRKKKAAVAEAKEKEARLAARRAEIEAAQARERELQRQLEAIEDESSSDDDLEQVTPQASTPTQGSQELERKEVSPPPAAPVVRAMTPPAPIPTVSTVTSPPVDSETRNPFFKKLAQPGETPSVAAPAPTPAAVSNNPFHRLPSQEHTAKAVELPPPQPMGTRSRGRPEEDEWSVVGSDNDDDSSDDEGPGAGNARQLASILFGTMAPPRPLSATGNGSAPVSPAIGSPGGEPSFAATPPPAPPLPGAGGAPPPPSTS